MERRRELAALAERVLGEQPLSVVDVGSLGGLLSELEPIAEWVDAIGFDPDEAACEADEARARAAGLRQRFLPYAVTGADSRRPFHVYRKSASSSLLEPNAALHARFAEPERMEVVRTIELDTRALGPLLSELSFAPEFLKLDVHGIEREVLDSFSDAQWDGLLAAHVELLLSEQYVGQTSWADVHAELARHGLELYALKRYIARRASFDTYRHWTRGQITTADALYLRRGEDLDPVRRRRLAVVAACFGHNDVADAELRAVGDAEGVALMEQASRRRGRLARWLSSLLIRVGEVGWRSYGPPAGPWAGDRPPEGL